MSPKPPSPCRWKRCSNAAEQLISGVPLCRQHHSESIALSRERNHTEFLRVLASKVTAESARDLEQTAQLYEDAEPTATASAKPRKVPGGAA